MNTLETLTAVFNEVFEDEINADAIRPEASLQKDLGISSIGMLYMAMALEERLAIKFTNEDLMKLSTVADVIACIEGKKK